MAGLTYSYGFDGTESSRSLYVTADGSAHTKGAWSELCASAPFDVKVLTVNINRLSAATYNLVDIGIGSAGNEQVLVANLHAAAGAGSYRGCNRFYLFPIAIPSGTRISARCQSSTGSTQVGVSVGLSDTAWFRTYDGVETIGADTANSYGVLINGPTVANTKGVWDEVAASISHDAKAVVANFGTTQSYGTFSPTYYYRIDLGVGASSQETVVLPDIVWSKTATTGREYGNGWYTTPPLPVQIPAGSRVTARMQNQTTGWALRATFHLLY